MKILNQLMGAAILVAALTTVTALAQARNQADAQIRVLLFRAK